MQAYGVTLNSAQLSGNLSGRHEEPGGTPLLQWPYVAMLTHALSLVCAGLTDLSSASGGLEDCPCVSCQVRVGAILHLYLIESDCPPSSHSDSELG